MAVHPMFGRSMTTTRELTLAERRRIAKLCFVGSACIYLFACYLAYGQWQLNRIGVIATGEVISFTGKKSRFPVVRFEAQDGETYTFQERHRSAFDPIHQGDHVEVKYPPGRPQEAWVVKNQWQLPWILATMASFFGGLGVLLLSIPGLKIRHR
jgi:hypothetical protein